ncbi:uncharacterized protein LOC122961098 [Acropora millepora]|uniref:uncharacterized protein LOC122961098 n=1 Tax=Acropora millepora TaxID=45264 RepID=UPI001CF4AF20|nr:uncharacterized protein LOC122961098 [Acropora millepora]
MPKTTITFSAKCKIFVVSGAFCSECNYLSKLHNRKTQRQEKRMGICRNCNKRYLTKGDVVLQLNRERKQRLNAEKREKYRKEKFLEESVQLEDGDHADRTTMLRTVPKENIPEELECLWEQHVNCNHIVNNVIIVFLLTGKTDPQLATHLLQFIFISDSGFRFPVAQFPSGECSPSDLYFNFWKGVRKMLEFGFVIYWCILDGAECNRQFVKLQFNGRDPVADKFIATNIHSGTPMVFIMDPKHNIKKIRSNLEKSNLSGKPRSLKIQGKNVTWQQFKDAFQWDQKSFSLPIHEKLTDQHFNLDPASKMRNHLAEDVLDDKMLFLMQKYH